VIEKDPLLTEPGRKTMADGGRTTHEHLFPWEEAFPRKETLEYLLT